MLEAQDSTFDVAKDDAKINTAVNSLKRRPKRKFAIFVSILLAIISVFYILFNFIPPFSKYKCFTIGSGSMRPNIHIGDVVVINKKIDLNSLEEGDVIAFLMDLNLNGQKKVVVHYVAQIEYQDGERIFYTKRENATSKKQWDPWTIKDEDILGEHSFTIPFIGKIPLFIQSSFGKLVLIVNGSILYIALRLLKETEAEQLARIRKKNKKNENS